MLRLFAFGLVVTQVGCTRASETWTSYSSERGGYTVTMPAERETTANKVSMSESERPRLADGGLPDLGDETLGGRPPAIFVVRWWDVQDLVPVAPAKYFDAIDRPGGKVLSRKDLKLGDFPGIEYTKELMSGTRRIHGRMFVVDRRIFALAVESLTSDSPPPRTMAFLESFRLQSAPTLTAEVLK